MDDKKPFFTFNFVATKKFSALEDKDNQELLKKWSMKETICAQMFTFDQTFQPYQKDEFVLDFLRDANVLSTLKVATSAGTLQPLGKKADKVKADAVPCSVLSMTFFDRLYGSVVRDTGNILKCYDEFHEDFTISDELRKMLLSEESDHYDLYTDLEKEELLFLLLKHLCLGGQVCQFEDQVDPYLTLTKQLYKDLISVQKHSETKELSITSSVFKISASDSDDDVYYPSTKSHDQSFSYLIIDPLKRHATVLYNKFGGGY